MIHNTHPLFEKLDEKDTIVDRKVQQPPISLIAFQIQKPESAVQKWFQKYLKNHSFVKRLKTV
jgi:hypothetical protein